MALLWSAVMITLQTQFSQNCWTGALVWYGPIKRREEWTASHLRMVFQLWSGTSLQLLWFYCHWSLRCCWWWDSLLLFCALASLTKLTLISLHLCAGALWKLMNCRDWLVVFALLEASVERKDFGASTWYQILQLLSPWNNLEWYSELEWLCSSVWIFKVLYMGNKTLMGLDLRMYENWQRKRWQRESGVIPVKSLSKPECWVLLML